MSGAANPGASRRSVCMPAANTCDGEGARTPVRYADFRSRGRSCAGLCLRRANIWRPLKTGGYGHRERIVRVNGLKTPWVLTILPRLPRNRWRLPPKIETPEEVTRAPNAGAGCRLDHDRNAAGVLGVSASLQRGAGQRFGRHQRSVTELRARHTESRECCRRLRIVLVAVRTIGSSGRRTPRFQI